MLTSLIKANPASIWKSWRMYPTNYNDLDDNDFGTSVAGTNFNVAGTSDYTSNGDFNTWIGTLFNYTDGQSVTVRALLFNSITTGTKTFEASLAAITPGDAQSVLTKSFGTAVSSGALAPNSTANGLYLATFVFDTAAKLNDLANGDFFALKIAQTANTGTHGTTYIAFAEMYNS